MLWAATGGVRLYVVPFVWLVNGLGVALSLQATALALPLTDRHGCTRRALRAVTRRLRIPLYLRRWLAKTSPIAINACWACAVELCILPAVPLLQTITAFVRVVGADPDDEDFVRLGDPKDDGSGGGLGRKQDQVPELVCLLLHGSDFNESQYVVGRIFLALHRPDVLVLSVNYHGLLPVLCGVDNVGVAALAESVAQQLEQTRCHYWRKHGRRVPCVLVGHSLGGLVAADFALARAEHGFRVVGVVGVSSPFDGSSLLRYIRTGRGCLPTCLRCVKPGLTVGRLHLDLSGDSEWLARATAKQAEQEEQEQEQTQARFTDAHEGNLKMNVAVPFWCLTGECDPLVRPASALASPAGAIESVTMRAVGHYSIMLSTEAWQTIGRWLGDSIPATTVELASLQAEVRLLREERAATELARKQALVDAAAQYAKLRAAYEFTSGGEKLKAFKAALGGRNGSGGDDSIREELQQQMIDVSIPSLRAGAGLRHEYEDFGVGSASASTSGDSSSTGNDGSPVQHRRSGSSKKKKQKNNNKKNKKNGATKRSR